MPPRISPLLRSRTVRHSSRDPESHPPAPRCVELAPGLAQAMVELGADVDAPSPAGVALEIATREGRREVAAWRSTRRS